MLWTDPPLFTMSSSIDAFQTSGFPLMFCLPLILTFSGFFLQKRARPPVKALVSIWLLVYISFHSFYSSLALSCCFKTSFVTMHFKILIKPSSFFRIPTVKNFLKGFVFGSTFFKVSCQLMMCFPSFVCCHCLRNGYLESRG